MVTQTHRKLGALGFAVAALVGVSLFCAGDASAITINSDTTLDDNVTDGIVVEEGSTVTLNLNGKTVTNTNPKQAPIINRGTLTIIGEGTVSTDQSGTAAVTNYPDAHLTISGGTYSSELWYIIRNYGDMTINAGVTVIGAAANANNASMVTNGWYGSVDVNNSENILANSGSFEPTLVINGGTFTAGTTNCSVIKNDDYSHLTINDGEFSQPQGSLPDCDAVILNWNHAEIYGGTYHSENGRIISNGAYTGGADDGILDIKGGTFTTGANGSTLGVGAGGNALGTVTISGGNFTKAPDAPLTGYELIIKGGTYLTGEINESLLSDDVKVYQSAEGATIVLSADYDTNVDVFDNVHYVIDPETAASNEAALKDTATETIGEFINQFETLEDGQTITLSNGAEIVVSDADGIRQAFGRGEVFVLHLRSYIGDLTDDLVAFIKSYLPDNAVVVDSYDYSLVFDVAEYADYAYISQLPGTVTLSYDLDGLNNANLAEGFERTWYAVRIHNEEVTPIVARYDAETDRIYFESDRFSTYVIAYVDTPVATTEIPKAPNTGVATQTATTVTSSLSVASIVAYVFCAVAFFGVIKTRQDSEA